MEKGKLIIVMGPSGSGKTMLANEIIRSGIFNDEEHKKIEESRRPEGMKEKESEEIPVSIFYAPKYVTRDLKDGDVSVIKCSYDKMEQSCDVIIPGYRDDDFIGFNVDDILKQIDEGKTLVIATGFMEALQEILKKFMDKDRLNNIFIVGMNTFTKDGENYNRLTKDAKSEDENISDDANKRLEQSALFVEQYKEFKEIFDMDVRNYQMKYEGSPNLRGEGYTIYHHASKPIERDSDQLSAIKDFVSCDLSKYNKVVGQ